MSQCSSQRRRFWFSSFSTSGCCMCLQLLLLLAGYICKWVYCSPLAESHSDLPRAPLEGAECACQMTGTCMAQEFPATLTFLSVEMGAGLQALLPAYRWTVSPLSRCSLCSLMLWFKTKLTYHLVHKELLVCLLTGNGLGVFVSEGKQTVPLLGSNGFLGLLRWSVETWFNPACGAETCCSAWRALTKQCGYPLWKTWAISLEQSCLRVILCCTLGLCFVGSGELLQFPFWRKQQVDSQEAIKAQNGVKGECSMGHGWAGEAPAARARLLELREEKLGAGAWVSLSVGEASSSTAQCSTAWRQ